MLFRPTGNQLGESVWLWLGVAKRTPGDIIVPRLRGCSNRRGTDLGFSSLRFTEHFNITVVKLLQKKKKLCLYNALPLIWRFINQRHITFMTPPHQARCVDRRGLNTLS